MNSTSHTEVFEKICHGELDDKNPVLLNWVRHQLALGEIPGLDLVGGTKESKVLSAAIQRAIEYQSFHGENGTHFVTRLFVVPIVVKSCETLDPTVFDISSYVDLFRTRMALCGLMGSRDAAVILPHIIPYDIMHGLSFIQAYDLSFAFTDSAAHKRSSVDLPVFSANGIGDSPMVIGDSTIYSGYIIGCAYGVRGRHQLRIGENESGAALFRQFIQTTLGWSMATSADSTPLVSVGAPDLFFRGIERGLLSHFGFALTDFVNLSASESDGLSANVRVTVLPRSKSKNLVISFCNNEGNKTSYTQGFVAITQHCIDDAKALANKILAEAGALYDDGNGSAIAMH